MDNLPNNLAYTLWGKKLPRDEWARAAASWMGTDERRAGEILRGAPATKAERERLRKIPGVGSQVLRQESLAELGKVDILTENLRYLIHGVGKGGKQTLAARLGVHPTTVSAWLAAKQRPERKHQVAITRYFGLPPGTDLAADAIFLAPSPVAEKERKRWLRERVQELDVEALNRLFPAFEKLLTKS